MEEVFARKKRQMNVGSIVSALGLIFYFVARSFRMSALLTGGVTLIAALISILTLLLTIACRQDCGKEVVSINRLAGQGAMTVLLALAAAVMLKTVFPFV